ncbi:SDR family NAD(P)-dependent oxidoreductase [Actinokineospora xionganensis]|uniref:SDR family NAD(P)-dependent oxidoreductase n=1 Tax=Actinokineospora xionganensis TaxID=2684470 RepID=A0ABR7KZV2_9PSEU|nr:SDR family NAD(P)-dependent oxidoreductase [Actinokineospora xionganensis]MBC6445967.1 SDR family NAD(P)-dependent oxidoreductase [Actinokineospora xionganensis]
MSLLFPISGRSPQATRANAGRLAAWLAGPGTEADPADIAHTLALRRSHLACRAFAVAADHAELGAGLRALAGTDAVEQAARFALPEPVLVFSGHGSQWCGMGAEMLRDEPVFAAVVDELEPVFAAEGRGSLRTLLCDTDLTTAAFADVQPAIFAVQYGLTRVLAGYGVRPAGVIGQSMGEVAAAAAAGALSVADAARVICRRSTLMQERLANRGATALLDVGRQDVLARLADRPGIDIAGYTSTRSTVVAGDRDQVAALVAECEAAGHCAHVVPGVGMAIHCRMVDDILPELLDELADLRPRTPLLRFYSTAVDAAGPSLLDAAYWAANLRNPVRLEQAVLAAVADGARVFVEVAPHPLLLRSLRDTLEDHVVRPVRLVETLRREQPARPAVLTTLGTLHTAGAHVDWSALQPAGTLVDLPTTAWQHQMFPSGPGPRQGQSPGSHPLLGAHVRLPGTPVRHVWQSTVDIAESPWLADHRVREEAVLPATAYCEMALAAAQAAFDVPLDELELSDVGFLRPLALTTPVTVTTMLTRSGAGATVEITAESDVDVVLHARASVTYTGSRAVPRPTRSGIDLSAENATGIHRELCSLGIRYGPAFTGLRALTVQGAVAHYVVRAPAELPRDGRFVFHPALLDACLHGIAAITRDDTGALRVPASLARLRVWRRPDLGGELHCRAFIDGDGVNSSVGVVIADPAGRPIAEIAGLAVRRLSDATVESPVDDLLYTMDWEGAPRRGVTDSGRTWSVVPLGGQVEVADALTAELVRLGGHAAGADEPDAIVLLADRGHPADPSAAALAGVQTALSGLRRWSAARPRLFVVTYGAYATGERPDLIGAGLVGLVRAVREELPELAPVHLDVSAGTTTSVIAEELAAAFGASEWDSEVALQGERRAVARFVRLPETASTEAPTPLVRPGDGYAITGGTGGLGLRTTRWLAARGAGHIALNARSEPGPVARREIEAIEASGTRISVVRGDIAEPGVAARLLAAVTDAGVPLRGVVHAAGVLDDGLLPDLDDARLSTVWRPKADGAWLLHEASVGHRLDWWIAYSSFAGALGSPGQANYAAANTFTDALVRWRHAAGLPGLSIAWGPWSEVGLVKDATFPGVGSMTPEVAFAALERAIGSGVANVVAAALRPEALLAARPHHALSELFARLVTAGERDDGFDVAALSGLRDDERIAVVRDRVRQRVCQVLGYPLERVTDDLPLVELGLDSLSAVQIRNAIRADFGQELPVSRVLQGATLADLARDLDPLPADTSQHTATATRLAERRAMTRAGGTARLRERRRAAR